jgi:outer membrane putative beta-barrel porin/alpha-amylase
MLGAILLVLAAQSAAPAAEEFCTDRPGLETGTCVMPAGVLQLETSLVDWTTDTADGVRTRQWTLGDSVIRFGIGSASEIQLGWTPWTRVTVRSGGTRETASGTGDASLAYKVRLTRADAPLALDLMPFVKLPLAKRPLGNRRLEGGLLAPIDIALADRWTLTLSPEGDWNADEYGRGHHLGVAGAVGLGFDVSESLSTGLTVWGERDADPGGTVHQAMAGAALAWVARPKLQFDLEADAGIGGAAPDLELIAGVSIRR